MSHFSDNSKMEETRIGPLLFHEIGATHAEVLSDGYEYVGDQIWISISKATASGMTFTSTAEKYGHRSDKGVRALCNYNGFGIDFELDKSSSSLLDSNDSISGKLGLTKEILPSMTAEAVLAFPNYINSSFGFGFLHRHATFSMEATCGALPGITLSATTGTPSVTLGLAIVSERISSLPMAAAAYSALHSKIILPPKWQHHWSAAIKAKRPTWDAFMTLEGHRFLASYVHYLDKAKKISAAIEMSRSFEKHDRIRFLAGGSWVIDQRSTVKARIGRRWLWEFETLLHHKINDKASFTVSCQFDVETFTRKPRIGLAVALKL